jgi:hypothetical protein
MVPTPISQYPTILTQVQRIPHCRYCFLWLLTVLYNFWIDPHSSAIALYNGVLCVYTIAKVLVYAIQVQHSD